MSKLESIFKRELIEEVKERLPGCFVTKLERPQGVPDILILHKDKWATLEVKKDISSAHQSNQDYYVEKFNDMSFSRFVNPTNKNEVLDELQQALAP